MPPMILAQPKVRLSACLGATEEAVLPAECDDAHALFGGIDVEFEDALIEAGAQALRKRRFRPIDLTYS